MVIVGITIFCLISDYASLINEKFNKDGLTDLYVGLN